jgi:glycine/D-amino acid oxidase-like deaminating enzyme
MNPALFSPEAPGRPYWWDEADLDLAQLADDPAGLPAKAEVLIVGAGYSGLSAALTLARAGRQVVVLDAEAPGFGCSSRNGGLLGPSFHKLGLAGLKAKYGEAKANAILAESMACLAFMVDFLAAEKIDCGFTRAGRFRGAFRPAHYERLGREIDSLKKAVGLEAEMVPKSEQHREIGSDFYHGGAVYPQDGHLQPARLVQGLIERVRGAGAAIYGGQRVLSIQREAGGFQVATATHSIAADKVMVATNGYTGPELAQFHRRLIPLRSGIIATEALAPALIAELSPKNRGLGDTQRLVYYYRPSPDGRRMIFGGRAFGLAERPHSYGRDLQRKLVAIFPQLAGARISHAWSGVVAYTFDHAPHLGELDGLYYTMGYCGSGVGRATYFGNKLALKILGDPQGKTSLDDLPFEGHAFYGGNPWFMPALIRWHALADRIGL